MFELPKLVARPKKSKQEITTFAGINFSENTRDGDFADSRGITTDNYPVLTPRKCRQSLGAYSRPTSIYYWDGLVVVDGKNLMYNGKVVGRVSEGEKQFAVVNTKLCIFPDKKYLDLNDLVVRSLDAKFNIAAGTARFEQNKLTITAATPIIAKENSDFPFASDRPVYVKTYTGLEWISDAWVKTGEQEKLVKDIAVNDLIIPAVSEDGAVTINTKDGDVWSGEENDVGIYIRVTSARSSSVDREYEWEKFNAVITTLNVYTEKPWDGWYLYEDSSYSGYTGYTFNEITGKFSGTGTYRTLATTGDNTATLYEISNVDGPRVIEKHGISGSFGAYYARTRRVAGPTPKSVYTRGEQSYGIVRGGRNEYPVNGRDSDDGYWYMYKGATGYDGTATVNYDEIDATGANGLFSNYFQAGDHIVISGCTRIPQNNKEAVIESVSDLFVTFTDTVFAQGNETAAITVMRKIPDLDYICSSNNRLWGVSNADKTIYASALGKPEAFYDYEGADTDSYAVAVGTDKDFTGICAYSDAVLCWKENVLHKILGNNPSDYYMATYTVNGVQSGSSESMRVINEVLYYKGVDGIYAYTGGTPSLISSALGMNRYRYAVAGCDDLHYHVSMENVDGSGWVYLIYDVLRGLWIKENDIRCNSFTEQNNTILYLSDSTIWQTGQPDGERVEWMAEFVPFVSIYSSLGRTNDLNRKTYTKLILRVDMTDGSEFTVETKEDNGPWTVAWEQEATDSKTVYIPLKLGRFDSFGIRLSGKGYSVVRAMLRDYTYGSEVY